MRKTLWLIFFFTNLGVPLFLYSSSAGTGIDIQTFAIITAITAYILICDQLILASRPAGLITAFGAKIIARFHAILPVGILALAIMHPVLKLISGFGFATTQASLGIIAFWLLSILMVFTVIFMANTVWLRIKHLSALKKWAYAKIGLTYRAARLVHGLFAGIAVLIAIHAVLASTSDLSVNPLGALWLCGSLVFALGMYIRYRIQQRK